MSESITSNSLIKSYMSAKVDGAEFSNLSINALAGYFLLAYSANYAEAVAIDIVAGLLSKESANEVIKVIEEALIVDKKNKPDLRGQYKEEYFVWSKKNGADSNPCLLGRNQVTRTCVAGYYLCREPRDPVQILLKDYRVNEMNREDFIEVKELLENAIKN